MRLSDERLAQRDSWSRSFDPHVPLNVPAEEYLALIAEVRALRECEKALEALIGLIPPDADPFESGDLWIGASGIISARAALAAVRALEDKP